MRSHPIHSDWWVLSVFTQYTRSSSKVTPLNSIPHSILLLNMDSDSLNRNSGCHVTQIRKALHLRSIALQGCIGLLSCLFLMMPMQSITQPRYRFSAFTVTPSYDGKDFPSTHMVPWNMCARAFSLANNAHIYIPVRKSQNNSNLQ